MHGKDMTGKQRQDMGHAMQAQCNVETYQESTKAHKGNGNDRQGKQKWKEN